MLISISIPFNQLPIFYVHMLDTFFFLVSLFISMFLVFYSLNLVLCLHLAINSLLLFNNLLG